MRLTNLLSILVLLCAFLATGCTPDQESPLSENTLTFVKQTTLPTADVIGDELPVADIMYTPGLIHTPVIGCDTLITPLVVSVNNINVTVGRVYITQTPDHLYFQVFPFSGLKIRSMSLFEGDGIGSVPLDKAGTPDFDLFPYKESFDYPKVRHTMSLPMNALNFCQAYSVHAEILSLNGSSGYYHVWDSWGWGHDLGDGFAIEACVPACGSIVQI